jgi:Response regulators consisting of a CheY-like receiver domain and a winged-helix DNA-binding domain
MHKDTYNINVACFCNQNFINAMNELKSYFGFNMFSHYKSLKDFEINKINAVIFDLENSKKFQLSNINLPKILIQESSKVNNSKNLFSLVIKLPLEVVQFNQDIINLCKKFEFKNNSLINIKDYVLDKNERVLKKNNIFLKITEKEINFLEILCSSTKPLTRDHI